jgi:hypothetical protein
MKLISLLFLLPLLTLLSCSSIKTEKKQNAAWDAWKGRPTSKLDEHPYFKHLKVKKIKNSSDIETWIFRDQSRFQTDSYCISIGGCIGMPIYNCDNVFSVKDNIILGFEQKGGCPGVKTIEVQKK